MSNGLANAHSIKHRDYVSKVSKVSPEFVVASTILVSNPHETRYSRN